MTIHFDEKGKFFTDVVTKEPIPTTIQTLTHRVHGSIHVRQGDRLKDTLVKAELFLAITEATVYSLQGKVLYETDFLVVHRDHIVWLLPDHELKDQRDTEGMGQS